MAELAPLRPLVSFLVAAPQSGSGKTVTTLGLIAALVARGHAIAPAKVGPDYIDTAFLAAAAGRPAVNLDLWAMRPALFDRLGSAPNLVVEGVMGLFDGPAAGPGSSADVARRLGLPIILVVNAERMSHSVAALVHGFATFDPTLSIAGVILTRVASPRHEAMLRAALAGGAVPCLGAIPRRDNLAVPSRHLGLRQAREDAGLTERIAGIAEIVAEHTDLAAIEALDRPSPTSADAASLSPLGRWNSDRVARGTEGATPLPPLGQRIALAHDDAFAFAYAHLVDGWHSAGATVHPFSPLAGEAPDPAADAVFLPGGYPELHAGRLAAEQAWARGIRARAKAGALIYGECGGYMALGDTLVDADGTAHEMAGLLPVTTSFAERRRTLGYRTLRHDGTALPGFPAALRGHEFHYATVAAEGRPLFQAADAAGTPLSAMGSVAGRVAGSFAHIIDGAE